MTDVDHSDSRPIFAFVGDSLTAGGSWQECFLMFRRSTSAPMET